MSRLKVRTLALLALAFAALSYSTAAGAETEARTTPLEAGDKADDFTLQSLSDEEFALYEHLKKGPVALIVLRGYTGYQCPVCSRQVGDYLAQAEKFAKLNTQVVFIYPGPSEELQARAEEFLDERAMPENFHFLIDPDYKFTNQYSLRWDEPRETAYPSTFVLDQDGVVKLSVISHSHRGRTKADDALKALQEKGTQAAVE